MIKLYTKAFILACLLVVLAVLVSLRLEQPAEAANDIEPQTEGTARTAEIDTGIITREALAVLMAYYSDCAEATAESVNERYSAIEMTDAERDELAAIVWLEARGESAEGQQAVAEVVLNRVISSQFPDTVHDVLHQSDQFSSIGALAAAEPAETQYDVIDAALYGDNVLPENVVFFSRGAENNSVWGTIGNHIFCYAYEW
ncbi:MAG: cell wall hydrolase [Oscillospiraceae bacterium]|nr:cell wall hydrolase [Oscillospiraceae bacterium]